MISSRTISLFLAFLAGASAGSVRQLEDAVLSEYVPLFRAWKEEHGKVYSDEESVKERLNIWSNNHERIEAHNHKAPTPSFLLGHNEYSDLTEDEFAERFNLGKYSKNAEFAKQHAQESLSNQASSQTRRNLFLDERRVPAVDINDVNLPDFVNWTQMGGVTPIKNQGACGSCWAFSTTGALEGAKFVKTGDLVTLSEQNLLDCDHLDMGCSGGLMDNAFKFDEKTGGLCSEEDYPYVAKQGRVCNPTNCTDVPGTIVSTFYDVPPGDEMSMLSAIAMQPISIAIQANQFIFQMYKSGVLTDSSCGARGDIDHGVLAVGYGTDLTTQEPYWLVKNSWGETWGDSGYIRMSRKSDNEFGMCAILKMASYPEVE